eukprot:scaffold11777_cov99-Isochrysis_galbana.AAC.3
MSEASSLSWSTAAPRHGLPTRAMRPAVLCPLKTFFGPTVTWSSGAEKRSSSMAGGEDGDTPVTGVSGASTC